MHGYQIYIKCGYCNFISFFYVDKIGENLVKNLIKSKEAYKKLSELPEQLKTYVNLFIRKPPYNYDKIIIVNKKWQITIGGELIIQKECSQCCKKNKKHQYVIGPNAP